MKTILSLVALLVIPICAFAADFKVKMLPYGDSKIVAIKWDADTGDAWGVNGEAWGKFKENGKTPVAADGPFDIIVSAHKDKANWYAIRVAKKTGQTWIMSPEGWKPMGNGE